MGFDFFLKEEQGFSRDWCSYPGNSSWISREPHCENHLHNPGWRGCERDIKQMRAEHSEVGRRRAGESTSLIKEWKPEKAPFQNHMNLRSAEQDPFHVLQRQVLAPPGPTRGARCAKRGGPALKKTPQIAHYKMIIAHIHVLLCFRK